MKKRPSGRFFMSPIRTLTHRSAAQRFHQSVNQRIVSFNRLINCLHVHVSDQLPDLVQCFNATWNTKTRLLGHG